MGVHGCGCGCVGGVGGCVHVADVGRTKLVMHNTTCILCNKIEKKNITRCRDSRSAISRETTNSEKICSPRVELCTELFYATLIV